MKTPFGMTEDEYMDSIRDDIDDASHELRRLRSDLRAILDAVKPFAKLGESTADAVRRMAVELGTLKEENARLEAEIWRLRHGGTLAPSLSTSRTRGAGEAAMLTRTLEERQAFAAIEGGVRRPGDGGAECIAADLEVQS